MKKNNVIFVDFTNKKRYKKGQSLFYSLKDYTMALIKKIVFTFSKYPNPTPIKKIN